MSTTAQEREHRRRFTEDILRSAMASDAPIEARAVRVLSTMALEEMERSDKAEQARDAFARDISGLRKAYDDQAVEIATALAERDRHFAQVRELCGVRLGLDNQLEKARAEVEKYRTASRVLCGTHVGVPQASCPVCDRDSGRAEVEALKRQLDHANYMRESTLAESRLALQLREKTQKDVRQALSKARWFVWSTYSGAEYQHETHGGVTREGLLSDIDAILSPPSKDGRAMKEQA